MSGTLAGSDKTGEKQTSARFRPGRSGNPAGRPQGSRNRATLAIEELLDGQAEALTQKAVELALAGDMQALRLCMERVCPPRKDRPVSFTMPKIETIADIVSAQTALLAAVATGEVTPAEAGDVSKLLDSFARAVELSELSERIERLETRMAQ